MRRKTREHRAHALLFFSLNKHTVLWKKDQDVFGDECVTPDGLDSK